MATADRPPEVPSTITAQFSPCRHARIERLSGGLINETFSVEGPLGSFVLQRVNSLFDPIIHENIAAVTRCLVEGGVATSQLNPADDGRSWVEDDAGHCWRLSTRMPGHVVPRLTSPTMAHATGALLGRWHRTLESLEHEFVGTRTGIHDTPAHRRSLEAAIEDCADHPLHSAVRSLADEIWATCAELPELSLTRAVVVHGDPKLDNFLFESTPRGPQPSCIIDLDTVSRQPLAYELGDAWRSWCAMEGSNSTRLEFDFGLFQSSLAGYCEGRGRVLTQEESKSLLYAADWISLELSMRFAADALRESYFGWDASQFESRGAHNLARAQRQLALHRSLRNCRPERARVLGLSVARELNP